MPRHAVAHCGRATRPVARGRDMESSKTKQQARKFHLSRGPATVKAGAAGFGRDHSVGAWEGEAPTIPDVGRHLPRKETYPKVLAVHFLRVTEGALVSAVRVHARRCLPLQSPQLMEATCMVRFRSTRSPTSRCAEQSTRSSQQRRWCRGSSEYRHRVWLML